MAILFNRKLFLATATKEASRDCKSDNESVTLRQKELQNQHLTSLKKFGYHESESWHFGDVQALEKLILKALIQLGDSELSINNLPSLPLGDTFLGRGDELERIWKDYSEVRRSRGIYINHVVLGMAGIGKTRLAIEYGWHYQTAYSAIFFLRANDVNSLRAELAETATFVGTNVPDDASDDERIEIVLAWLQANANWLLIVDNVDEKSVRDYVNSLLRYFNRGHVLITGRLSEWNSNVTIVPLNVLSLEQSRQYLLTATENRVISIDDDKYLTEITQYLAGLCLALAQAASYIVSRQLTLKDYTERWKHNQKDVLGWGENVLIDYHPESSHAVSIATTWSTTIANLTIAARQLMNLVASFAPNAIPVDAVKHFFGKPARHQLQESALHELESYSLIEIENKNGNLSISMHPIIRCICRSRMKSKVTLWDSILFLFRPILTIRSNLHPRIYDFTLAFKLADLFSDSSQSVAIKHGSVAHALFHFRQLASRRTWNPTCHLGSGLAQFLAVAGRHDECADVYEELSELLQIRYGRDSREYAHCLGHLADAFLDCGSHWRALRAASVALEQHRSLYGEKHAFLASSLSSLADIYAAMGDIKRGCHLNNSALDIIFEDAVSALMVLRPHKLIKIFSQSAYFQLVQGNYESASHRFARCLELVQRADEMNSDLRWLIVLGRCNAESMTGVDTLPNRENHIVQAVKYFMHTYPVDHPKVAYAQAVYALFLRKLGFAEDALPWAEESVRIVQSHDANRFSILTLRVLRDYSDGDPTLHQTACRLLHQAEDHTLLTAQKGFLEELDTYKDTLDRDDLEDHLLVQYRLLVAILLSRRTLRSSTEPVSHDPVVELYQNFANKNQIKLKSSEEIARELGYD